MILAALIMFILISLTAVSAVDANQTDNIAAENIATVPQDILTVESADTGDFKELNENVTGTETLELTKNYTYNLDEDSEYKDGINITHDIAIDGKGYTISGNNQARIFNIANAAVTLKNINFINGNASSGAAIYCKNGNLTIINCNFTNNNAYDDELDGGAIDFAGSQLAIDNSIFAKNTASLNSGAINFNGNTLSISNSEFKANRAEEFAGAVGVEKAGDVKIINTNFNNNTAKNYGALGIYKGNILIDNSTFAGNNASDEVGAIYLNCEKSQISNSNFTGNTAGTDTIIAHATGDLTVDNSQFIYNYAESGNIIHNAMNGNLTVSNSYFDSDCLKGRTIVNNYGNLYLQNNTIESYYNEIYSYGGKITSPVTAVILNNKTQYKHLNEDILIHFIFYDDNDNMMQVDDFDLFVNNTKVDYVFNDRTRRYEANFTSDKLELYTVSIASTSLTNLTSENAEIVIMNVTDDLSALNKLIDECNDTLTLTQNYTFNPLTDVDLKMGIIINENITIDGAGFTLNGSNLASIFFVESNNVTIKNITFINANYSDGMGGAIYWVGDNGQLTDCTFINNHAEEGGAVLWIGDNGTISKSKFMDNSACKGGAISISYDGCQISDCSFTNNTVDETGGAIYLNDGDSVILNCNFTENNAIYGGAVYADNKTSSLNVDNSNFKANTAAISGAIRSYNNTAISNCKFEENMAIEGGALVLEGTSNTINNSTFRNNTAVVGGAASIENANITNSNFTDNKATAAGALAITHETKIINSNFKNNTAEDGSDNIATAKDAKVTLENVSPENMTILAYVDLTAGVNDVKYGTTLEINVTVRKDGAGLNEGSVFVVINDKIYTADVVNGNATIKIPNLDSGHYDDVKVTYNGNGKYTNSFNLVHFTVEKQETAIAAASKTYVINYGGKYYITLKDKNGKKLSGKTVTLTINGKTYKANTNAKGVATIKLSKAMLKSAGTKKATIKFAGDKNYNASTKTVKITVKKESVKILKAKKTYTFKKSKKTKNIKVVLKNSKNKALKKVKVTLKLTGKKIKGKKTITAKSNSKGVVTFKLGKKLTQKTKVKYSITYKGNAYYNKVVKKGTIRIK